MGKLRFVLLALGLFGCAHEPIAQPAPPAARPVAHTLRLTEGKQHLIPLPEILKRLKDSPRQYEIHAAAQPFSDAERAALAISYWGASRGAYLPEVTRDATGAAHVRETQPRSEVETLLAQAEAPYQQHDFAAAEALYAQALAIDPRDYHALVSHAECLAYQGRLAEALQGYEAAIAVNPLAHVAWEYKGEVLLAMHRREDALDAYAHALALKPHWKPLLDHLRHRETALGIELAPDRLLPAVRVSPTEKGAKIEFDPTHPEWLGFGACKAVWQFEPDHRREVLGTDERMISSAEERECLAALLTAYANVHDQGKSSDPRLDEALEIVKAGASDELLAYEVLSRADGNLTAQLPPELLEKLVAYVRWYVLVDRRVTVR